jgi:TRAP-type C4-dicarboxylate transport system substrate-binding protein
LSQGVADGQDTPTPVVKSNKYYEVQKYISKTDHVLTIAYVVMNPAAFNGLTADEQKWVLAAAKDADAHLRATTEKDETEAFTFLKDKGMQVNLTPDAESFRVATGSVIEKNPELFLPDLVKMARATPG